MKKSSQYLFGGIFLLIFLLVEYLSHSNTNPFLLALPLLIVSLLIIMTGVFELKEYYNKYVYLLLVSVMVIIMLKSIYLSKSPTSLNKLISAVLFTSAMCLLSYDFLENEH